jgi:quercetin dioxygenase-like cupin family protein
MKVEVDKMVETHYSFQKTDAKLIERILEDGNAALNHMVLPQGEALPLHNANSNVYMAVVRGTVSLKLDGQPEHKYLSGSVLVIPFGTRMNVYNADEGIVELFVFKSPSPSKMVSNS